MTKNTFSKERLETVVQLAKVLNDCRALEIKISGISEYEVKKLQDTKGIEYLIIS